MRGGRSRSGKASTERSYLDLVPQASAPASPATGRQRVWVDSSGVVRRLPAGATQAATSTTGTADPTAAEPNGSTYAQQAATPKMWVRVSSAWVAAASVAALAFAATTEQAGLSFDDQQGVTGQLGTFGSSGGSLV